MIFGRRGFVAAADRRFGADDSRIGAGAKLGQHSEKLRFIVHLTLTVNT